MHGGLFVLCMVLWRLCLPQPAVSHVDNKTAVSFEMVGIFRSIGHTENRDDDYCCFGGVMNQADGATGIAVDSLSFYPLSVLKISCLLNGRDNNMLFTIICKFLQKQYSNAFE